MLRRQILLFLLGLAATQAQTSSAVSPAPEPPRVRGLFDFQLPNLDPPGTIKLIFHPHVSDLIRRDYLRTDMGLRWALNDDFEVSVEADTYINHRLGGANPGNGIGELRLGTKYVFKDWLRPQHEASVSFDFSHPHGTPPLDMTDGVNHYQPSLTIQRHSRRNAKLTTFASVGLDLITPSSSPGTFGKNEPHDNSASFTGGAVYDLGQFKWTLSATYTTTTLIGDESHQFVNLQPSVLWYVPKKYTFNFKTQWIVGLGVRSSWGPDGYDFGLNTRVRAEITFRQVLENIRERTMGGKAR
ncbi:hypothetical protein [Opitutus sp. GAS368]|jgi:hypothetical protein|uniref:hypothetical protein n=1 Tax=Opitutus sp. GAS368 TaxID=1882749 RepID=UPI00087BAF5E|nr:hypothetical protein [Opitutus sp. GAS368]SDS65375.1 hypothetical protein SAMN05444173_3549 [Opitutus sp. GAS368]